MDDGNDFNKFLRLVACRYSSSNVDKVAGLFFLLGSEALPQLPIYKPNEDVEEAWKRLVNALSNQWKWEITIHISQPFDQLFPTWDSLMSAVIEDRRDLPSPLLLAGPLVGSLGLSCRSTINTSRIPGDAAWWNYFRGIAYRINRPRLDKPWKWTGAIYALDLHPEVTLTFGVACNDMGVRTTDSNPNGFYYIVPRLGWWKEAESQSTDESPSLHTHCVPHSQWFREWWCKEWFLVCVPHNHQQGWDGIALKKVGIALLSNDFGDPGSEKKLREILNGFYQGPDLEILADIGKLSSQAMKEKYGSRQVYSLIY